MVYAWWIITLLAIKLGENTRVLESDDSNDAIMADMKYMFMTYQALACVLHKHHFIQFLKKPCVSKMKSSTAQQDAWHRAGADQTGTPLNCYLKLKSTPKLWFSLFTLPKLRSDVSL